MALEDWCLWQRIGDGDGGLVMMAEDWYQLYLRQLNTTHSQRNNQCVEEDKKIQVWCVRRTRRCRCVECQEDKKMQVCGGGQEDTGVVCQEDKKMQEDKMMQVCGGGQEDTGVVCQEDKKMQVCGVSGQEDAGV
ncbi:hypothetical protein Pcinc_036113 [Petrolisthes cinctipes]|uniref:Uncharacterized protein n=1 Tax=Petrolisthes cinctipes TaxID=88211 RepID=A0AAE1BZI7_PETCI|nr:hypothetical protein Pcinc_036113 [Petrolisthes cinctipes]